MKYNDPQHIKNYEEGLYPQIHDAIYSAIIRYADKEKPALEVGACLGLLSARMIDGGIVPRVLAFEPSLKNLTISVRKPEIKYYCYKLNKTNVRKYMKAMNDNQVKTVIARRVFPEVAEAYGVEVVKLFAKAASVANVKTIILEGRKKTENPKAALHNADLEAACFEPYFKVVEKYKDVRILERVNER